MKVGDLVLTPYRKKPCMIMKIDHFKGSTAYLIFGDGRLEWVTQIKEVI